VIYARQRCVVRKWTFARYNRGGEMRGWLRTNKTIRSYESQAPRVGWTALAALVGLVGLAAALVAATPWWMEWASSDGSRTPGAHDLTETTVAEAYGDLRLWFEPNQGQANEQVTFQARGFGYNVRLTREAGAVLVLSGDNVLRMDLIDASSQPVVAGVEVFEGVSNYLIGSDPDSWHTGVPHYRRVHYEQVYPGIDLAFYGSQGHLEYDFIVAPGADPSQIRVAFGGADKISVTPSGDLALSTGRDDVLQRAPVVFQEIDGDRREVEGAFRLLSQSTGRVVVGFELGGYDPVLPLVIDPKIDYSTYLGGNDKDWGKDVAIDSSGNVYVTGRTYSSSFPTHSAMGTSLNGNNDVFVTKFDPTGGTLVYSTYLGGSSSDGGESIAVDSSGNAYVTGSTGSADFPIVNAYQPSYGGSFDDAFVLKLNAAGSALIFSTYWGGASNDFGQGIDLDIHGNPHVTGNTYSTDFPTKSPYQGSRAGSSGRDAFISKFNDTGTYVWYSTYFGGGGDDFGEDIVVNSLQQVYVVGYTESIDFPTNSAVQKSRRGSADAFITKMNSSGTPLFSTYHGGSSMDGAKAVTVGPGDRPYFTGWTVSTDFPTLGAYQPTFAGIRDAFVAKFLNTGTITYSTYMGGSDEDWAEGIAVDQGYRPHVAGWTDSTDFPLADPVQDIPGGASDGMVFLLDASGAGLLHSTYLGGLLIDYASSIAVDSSYQAFITGMTYSTDFPTRNAYQPTHSSQRDIFLTKLDTRSLDFFIAAVPGGLTPEEDHGAVRRLSVPDLQ